MTDNVFHPPGRWWFTRATDSVDPVKTLSAAMVLGLGGVVSAIVWGFTPVTWVLLGVAIPLAFVPVVQLFRLKGE